MKNSIKKITAKQLGIYIGAALGIKLLINSVLYDPLLNGLQAIYLALPAALQKLLYSAPGSLAQLDPTPSQLSILFAVGVIENLSILIELSTLGALLWLVYKGVKKVLKSRSTT